MSAIRDVEKYLAATGQAAYTCWLTGKAVRTQFGESSGVPESRARAMRG